MYAVCLYDTDNLFQVGLGIIIPGDNYLRGRVFFTGTPGDKEVSFIKVVDFCTVGDEEISCIGDRTVEMISMLSIFCPDRDKYACEVLL